MATIERIVFIRERRSGLMSIRTDWSNDMHTLSDEWGPGDIHSVIKLLYRTIATLETNIDRLEKGDEE